MRRRDRKNERGASLVEFALVAPLFFLFIFGLIEASAIMFSRNTIGLAVSDATRFASLNTETDDHEIIKQIMDASDRAFGARVVRIVIFEAPGNRSYADTPCRQGTPQANCASYDGTDLTGTRTPPANGWLPENRDPDDLLGIWVRVYWDGITGVTPLDVVRWQEQRVALVEPEVS